MSEIQFAPPDSAVTVDSHERYPRRYQRPSPRTRGPPPTRPPRSILRYADRVNNSNLVTPTTVNGSTVALGPTSPRPRPNETDMASEMSLSTDTEYVFNREDMRMDLGMGTERGGGHGWLNDDAASERTWMDYDSYPPREKSKVPRRQRSDDSGRLTSPSNSPSTSPSHSFTNDYPQYQRPIQIQCSSGSPSHDSETHYQSCSDTDSMVVQANSAVDASRFRKFRADFDNDSTFAFGDPIPNVAYERSGERARGYNQYQRGRHGSDPTSPATSASAARADRGSTSTLPSPTSPISPSSPESMISSVNDSPLSYQYQQAGTARRRSRWEPRSQPRTDYTPVVWAAGSRPPPDAPAQYQYQVQRQGSSPIRGARHQQRRQAAQHSPIYSPQTSRPAAAAAAATTARPPYIHISTSRQASRGSPRHALSATVGARNSPRSPLTPATAATVLNSPKRRPQADLSKLLKPTLSPLSAIHVS